MTTNEKYNEQLMDYCASLLKSNRQELLDFLDKSYCIEKFKQGTDLVFKTDLKSITFSKHAFTMNFNTPIQALSGILKDIRRELSTLDYEHPRYIYISLEINQKTWIWFEAFYPAWDFKEKTLSFPYRIEKHWNTTGNLLMGELYNYRDFPFLEEITLDLPGDAVRQFNDKLVIDSPSRLLFENYVTLDLLSVKYNNYMVGLSFYY